jgi:hypothetical protein
MSLSQDILDSEHLPIVPLENRNVWKSSLPKPSTTTFFIRCKSQSIIPKEFAVQTLFHSRHTSKIVQSASQAFMKGRIHIHWHKASLLENFLKSSLVNSDQHRIFTAVENSFRKIFNKQRQTHIHKLSTLNNQQNRPTPISTSNKFILNLSEHILIDAEEAVLKKGSVV